MALQATPSPPADPTAASPAGEAASMPLMLKGLVACLLLMLYAGVVAAYILAERSLLAEQRVAMNDLQSIEEAFKRGGLAVSNALLALRQKPLDAEPGVTAREAIPYALEAVEQSLRPWHARFPNVVALQGLAQRRFDTLDAQPTLANLIELREALEVLGREIDREQMQLQARRHAMAQESRDRGDRITMTSLVLGLGGLVVFGGIAALFFARLASDIRVLGTRATRIVTGYRGEPLEVTRRDEVGALTRAVNHMAADLAARERDLRMVQELRAHREKMAALGAMARNLSHEIGNPLAAISAIAQSTRGAQGDGGSGGSQAEVILAQTHRIAQITRRIADFASAHTEEPQPVDAGSMVRTVCDFMRFDPRFSATRIEVHAPADLPAAFVAPDHLSEVLMNLLQLCVDPEAGVQPPKITVDALAAGSEIAISVRGGSASGDEVRRERTRQLVEGMRGRMSERGADGCDYEIALPVLSAAYRGT